jgi:ABC-type branched-subunit amino acid transport system ATPase component
MHHLLVEHDMGLVMDVCDNILAISFGKKLAQGSAKEIHPNKDVQAAYLGAPEEVEDEELLEIRNLVVRYGVIEALHGINIDVEQGRWSLSGC